jgi:hypothetical protein
MLSNYPRYKFLRDDRQETQRTIGFFSSTCAVMFKKSQLFVRKCSEILKFVKVQIYSENLSPRETYGNVTVVPVHTDGKW